MRVIDRVTLTILLAASALPAWGQAIRIQSTTAVERKIPVAIPEFVTAPGMEAAAREMASALANDLTFTGLFTIAPRETYPASFTGFTTDASQIDFEAWRSSRIDYLVYAIVTAQGNAVSAECRMFDVLSGTQVIGQRLSAQSNLPRLVAHRFSEEIVRVVDGIPGIASSRICFSGRTGSGNKELFLADYDGYNVKQLTSYNSISIKPKFSPDGTRIAYLSYKDRYPFLYVLDLTTGRSTPLSKNVGLNAAPAWSPDGRQLAVVLSKDGNTEVYIKNADGSGGRRITNDRGSDTSPTFSPDGSQIAFVSDRGGTPQIYVMDANGGNVRRISYQGGKGYDPVWSPDGKMIAYVAERPGDGMEIYVMNADGSNPLRLTDSSGSNESPSWSADSRHVIFYSTRNSGLWAVNVRPPHEEHPINVGMRAEGPTWGPRRQ